MAEHDLETDDPTQTLAQFEPDPDGLGDATGDDAHLVAPAGGGVDDPQWVVFQDPNAEADWPAAELVVKVPARRT
jgi:hypothetical protein